MLRPVSVLLLAAGLAAGPAAAADPAAGEPLFQAHCTTCHPADRALKKHKDRAGWEKTVKRMQGYASGLFGDPEATAIIEYLVTARGPES